MRRVFKSRRARPFGAMLAHILARRPRVTVPDFWTAVVELREKYNCPVPARFPCKRGTRPVVPPVAELEAQPHALEWILSDTFCVAPKQWPTSMLGAFRYRLIPSPFEFGSTELRAHVPFTVRDQRYYDFVYLKFYAYGMPIRLIAKHCDVDEDTVHEGLYRAMSRMYEFPVFVVWATATDFRSAKILPQMWEECRARDKSKRITSAKRGALLRKLQTDLFMLDTEALSSWVNSPFILSYLIHATPKQPRSGLYPCDPRLERTHV